MDAIIWKIGISERVAGFNRARVVDVVRIVAGVCTIHLVVISRREITCGKAGKRGGLVNTAECVVCNYTLRNIEAVGGQVARVVVREETGGYDSVCVVGADVEVGLKASRLISLSSASITTTRTSRTYLGGACARVSRERSAIVHRISPDDIDVSNIVIVISDFQLRSIDDGAILDDVSSDVTEASQITWVCPQASNLCLPMSAVNEDQAQCNPYSQSSLIAPGLPEDLLAG